VTEAVFSWPGLGTYLIDAVLKRDYPVIEAATFITATASLLGTRLGNAAQALVDPRSSR
jgi:ABC-type dipeptide/oligopeptide/nickel transport system permease component